MRVNARLDDTAQEQLGYLTQATGQSVSHVVRESVARYYTEVRSRRQGPRRLLAMVGQGDSGRSHVASNVKREVGESIAAKHRQPLGG